MYQLYCNTNASPMLNSVDEVIIIQYLYFVHNKNTTFFTHTTLHTIQRKRKTFVKKQTRIKK